MGTSRIGWVGSLAVALAGSLACQGTSASRSDAGADGGDHATLCGSTAAACALPPLEATPSLPSLLGIRDGQLYFVTADYDGDADRTHLQLWRRPTSGGPSDLLYSHVQEGWMSEALLDARGLNVYAVYQRPRLQDFVLWRLTVTTPVVATRIDDSADVPPDRLSSSLAIDIEAVGAELYYSVSFPMDSERYGQSGLYRVASGGEAPARVLAAQYGMGIGTQGGDVYFSGIGIEGTEGGNALVRVPAEGGAPIVLLADKSPPGSVSTVPRDFVVGPMGIFWATSQQVGTFMQRSELTYLSLEGGAPRTLFELPETSTWDDEEYYGLRVRPLTAAPPTIPSAPIYFDVNHWVFGELGTTDLMRLALDETAPTGVLHVDHVGAVGTVAFDGPHLYFAYSGDANLSGYGIGRVDRCGCPAP